MVRSLGTEEVVAMADRTRPSAGRTDTTAPSKDMRALIRVLEHHRISVVLDVGANVGQYASRLRAAGWAGRIVSFEPLAAAHATLCAAAAADPAWQVAPLLALGPSEGTVTLNVSPESDMSSLLPLRPDMAQFLSSARFTGAERVPQARLDAIWAQHVAPLDRAFLKLDTQGYDGAVLDGALGVLDAIAGVQVELALVGVYEGEPLYLDMIARLASLGFEPVLFIPGYFNRRSARLLTMDGVFVRLPGQP
jgi:FkbM family methyltransferase